MAFRWTTDKRAEVSWVLCHISAFLPDTLGVPSGRDGNALPAAVQNIHGVALPVVTAARSYTLPFSLKGQVIAASGDEADEMRAWRRHLALIRSRQAV